MIFREDLAVKVIYGEKTVTRRILSPNPRSPWWEGGCRYNPGQHVAVQPGRGRTRIGDATVVSVTLEQLGNLTDAEAHAEGFTDPAAFEAAWASMHGTYNPHTRVWRIVLRAA